MVVAARWLLIGALVVGLSPVGALASGSHPFEMPDGGRVVAEALDGERLDVYFELPDAFLLAAGQRGGFDETWLEAWQREAFAQQVGTEREERVRAIVGWVVDPRRPDGGWVPLTDFLPPVAPPPRREGEGRWDGQALRPLSAIVPSDTRGERAGALSGKVVYVSAGHGFTWTSALGRWATQRGNTNEIVEDLVSAETVNHYLVPYLRNAGATVFTVREHDLNTDMVIVDGDQGGGTTVDGAGTYQESGAGWADGPGGFRAGLAPYVGDVNPFAQGVDRVVSAVSGAATAWATWIPEVPADGDYHVYVSYSQAANRAPDARYVVRHPGGETTVRVDQRRHGRTWVDLGRFWFAAGTDAAQGAVVLYNDSATGATVSADAVRLGGGMGDAARGTGSGVANGPTSKRPRWEECSRYHIQFSGAPKSVYGAAGDDRSDDVGARSRYAAWQNETGEDAVYVAWHTNAPNPGRGTSTYVYGPNPPNGSYNFTGVAGSDQLARKIHDELVNDIRAAFDPTWRDRGVFSAYFGEVNPNNNPEMPAALVEVAFHDTPADAALLKEPRFRQVAARAYLQGIVKYFAARDQVPVALLPDPPVRARVVGLSASSARVSWAPPPVDASGLGGDAPTGYRVYRSPNGRAWDDGTDVVGATSFVADGLAPGVPTYFRVTAFNTGGESFTTPTLAVSTSCEGGPTPALIVYGFYRFDSYSLPRDDLAPWSLGSPLRLRQAEANSFEYVVDHAAGFAVAGVPFDSSEATAVEAGDLPLAPYRAVDWVLGEESTADETFNAVEQALVLAWLGESGHRLLIASGAELWWDLEAQGSPSDVAFAHTVFGAEYAADSAGTWGVVPVGALAGLPALDIDDGSLGAFRVFYADVVTPLAGAVSFLEYEGGAGTAGAWFEGPGWTAVTLGVPLEALSPASARDALLAGVLTEAGLEALDPASCGAVAEPPVAEPGVDASGGDTAAPGDTATPGDASPAVDGLGPDGAPGADVPAGGLAPYREVSSATRTLDGGCASGGSAPWWALVVLAGAAWLARRRRRPVVGG